MAAETGKLRTGKLRAGKLMAAGRNRGTGKPRRIWFKQNIFSLVLINTEIALIIWVID